MVNEIVLRRRNKITISDSGTDFISDRLVVSLMKNVESLGFTFDSELFNILRKKTKDELAQFNKELIPILKEMCGADVVYTPMYPNFPQQVIDMDDLELFINAIIHYWSFGTLMPEYEKEERLPLIDNPALVTLSVGSMDDYWEIFSNLLSSKTNISEDDKADIETIITDNDDYYNHLPETIPYKENVAYLCKTIMAKNGSVNAEPIQKYFKTATDVLRLITSMSDGDISLAKNTKFRHLKRPERRLVMDLLAGCGYIQEDMYRYRDRWIRIGEIVHPAEFSNVKYNQVKQAFDMIRNQKKPLYFSGKVQRYINSGEIIEAVKLLENRPGEFARQLDKLVRDCDKPNYVVNSFAKVANQVQVPLLFNLCQHFSSRNDEKLRVVMPKGMVAKAYTIPSTGKEIDPKICEQLVAICENAIVEQLKEKEYLGKVYLDEEFKCYVAPFSQRSASSSKGKTLTRGSRIKISDNAEIIRGFIWWTNMIDKDGYTGYTSRVDIDLSASIYDDNWSYLDHVSWTNLRSRKYQGYHSGDRTNGGSPNGKGVAEFIDFKLDTFKDARYVVFTVHSFNGQPFDTIGNVRFGWMEREDLNSGEIFEPSTVEMAIGLNAHSVHEIPVVFDLKTREFVWCDLSGSGHCGLRGNSIEENLSGTIASCYAAVNLNKPTLYNLVYLNAIARGSITTDRNEADIIFSNDTTKPTMIEIDEDGQEKEVVKDTPIYTVYNLDYYMGQMF